jgi:glutamine amidotransferase
MIAIIDSGVANLASVMAALHRLKAEAVVTSDAASIRAASHVILPGVGAAAAAMAQLKAKKLVDAIRGLTQPMLGICLGMQLLFTSSEEGQAGDAPLPCLDVIPGAVRGMTVSPETPVPHMGWNQIKILKPDHPLLGGVMPDSFVYFVHSYAAPVGDDTLASAEYGGAFTAIAARRNFLGCQFHPERSSAVGSQILQNFLRLA